MPIIEQEHHQYLQTGASISGKRMIVGTFPIYSLTNPRTPRKIELLQERRDIDFFYGSRSNAFWKWYKRYVDDSIDPSQPENILESLRKKNIAISDVIKDCSRIDESFEDNKLRNKHWNNALAGRIDLGVEKILCTSKSKSGAMGWLINKILIPAGYSVNASLSSQLHAQILTSIPSANHHIRNVATVLKKNSSQLSIVSLPSPGSPERMLSNFGYIKNEHSTAIYLHQYLTASFKWFDS